MTRFQVLMKRVSTALLHANKLNKSCSVQFSSVAQCVRLFATPETAARQASLPITISRSLLKPTPIELVMPSNHPILCRPLLLLPSIFPSIRVFSDGLSLHIRWARYWGFINKLICILIQLLFQDTF